MGGGSLLCWEEGGNWSGKKGFDGMGDFGSCPSLRQQFREGSRIGWRSLGLAGW